MGECRFKSVLAICYTAVWEGGGGSGFLARSGGGWQHSIEDNLMVRENPPNPVSFYFLFLFLFLFFFYSKFLPFECVNSKTFWNTKEKERASQAKADRMRLRFIARLFPILYCFPLGATDPWTQNRFNPQGVSHTYPKNSRNKINTPLEQLHLT